MGMGKPAVCRTTELALPIPAVRSIRKKDNETGGLRDVEIRIIKENSRMARKKRRKKTEIVDFEMENCFF
jgi:hypothetical protein